MIYNLFAVHVKLLKLKGNTSWENTEKKNICMTVWNLLSKKRFLEDIKRKYSAMDATKKKELLSHCNEKLVKARSVELCINQFKMKIREGLYFICTVCNRILYEKLVITCINKKYPCQTYFNIQHSFDGKQYICNTCHSKVIKGKLPCQAEANNMYVDEIPTELSSEKN